MDIFIQNVPDHVNHVELRMFLREKLRKFDIQAFDIFKKQGNNWAILTIANPDNGRKFLGLHGFRGRQPLMFQHMILNCKMSNKKGQPEPLKVITLLQKEEDYRLRRGLQPSVAQAVATAQPRFAFQSLMTGVWAYDRQSKLYFDKKFTDMRVGSITFGKSALVIYLQKAERQEYDWHGRIDIPYSILEHTIPSIENGKRGSITLTLKSPPKFYQILGTDDLHLYTGGQAANSSGGMPDLAALAISALNRGRPSVKLERLCSLHPRHGMSSALCMVYKLLFPNLHPVYQAWAFIKDFSVPNDYWWKLMASQDLLRHAETEYNDLQTALSRSSLLFGEKFQAQALVLEGTVTPSKMLELLPHVHAVSGEHDSKYTALAIRTLGRQLPTPAPQVDSTHFDAVTIRKLLHENASHARKADTTYESFHGRRKQQQHLALTYKATVTPTGIILRGPDWSVSNRVLRKYAKHAEYFMRVFFADEDGMSVFYDPRASQEHIYTRFRNVLRQGITVAGRTFEFLGFSHASLRCHQTWFMAPFVHDGQAVRARDVIRNLGDFTNIHCSAKCAARIGQAFSDTIFAVPIPSTALVLETKEDLKRNGRCFSDGCGTLSLELFQKVWRALPSDRRDKRPTVLQIRYRGAKGVLSLDTSLRGEQLHVRQSMTKYIATEGWRDLELCGAAYSPLRMYLNHQFIKILEDLGVPLKNFLSVQDEACKALEKVVKHPLNAASFLEYSHSGVHAKVPRLFELMHYIGLSFHADRFLTDIVEVAAMSSLRSLKYRARIPIEKGYLLYGIMDETNTLKEGEVYITTEELKDSGRRERSILLGDRIVVTRAPALHPGDVQLVSAVNVPNESPLRALHNCIVFSQQGARDLPSQLSGGDLDGDLFHIIYDSRLIPDFTSPPADYAPASPNDLGRPVEVNDIVDFFIEFMNMDRLGQISNMHKIRADQKSLGTHDSDCITLAKLASDAVDFSKSGVPADLKQVPRGNDMLRPDFMAPGHNLVINELGSAALEELENEDIDDPDSLSVLDPSKSRVRYYRSDKVLGHLYRNIDEKKFFDRMKGDFEAMRHTWGSESLVQKLERYIDRETRLLQWEHHRQFAEDLRDYELNMVEIMDTLRAHRGQPLTELEVFSGNILGKKERASTRHIREANQEVQERFDRDVSGIIRSIIHGEEEYEGENDTEALPRSIACFKVALESKGWENQVLLKSWKYVAAAVCLEQLWKYQGQKLRPL
ncbi:RNA dependent RNA polymerase-domain-containing protein [Paraphoma chrysanthemicola]|nr:RNA dependent RNA polymerase-domain-containing protein [Paraphoma chrysanthemicola]